MPLYVSENYKPRNIVEESRISFQELMKGSYRVTNSKKFTPKLQTWYYGHLDEITLTKTAGKGYPNIKIAFKVIDEDEEEKEASIKTINISHVLSNSHGHKALKDIKILLSNLGVNDKEIASLENIESEYTFVEYLQRYVGTKVKIKSLSDSSYKSYEIQPIEEKKNE